MKWCILIKLIKKITHKFGNVAISCPFIAHIFTLGEDAPDSIKVLR